MLPGFNIALGKCCRALISAGVNAAGALMSAGLNVAAALDEASRPALMALHANNNGTFISDVPEKKSKEQVD